ncbi:MAG: sugar ABC transporter permease [Treponema sp.]|jgi:sn-glycerol 3-phosphate transport system permease protein|nr:sugar ABC transporter permease [Treponema sp.]
MKKKNLNLAPYIFLLPSLGIFVVFVFFPFVKTFVYSFTLTNSRGRALEFTGLENYIKLFSSPAFFNSLRLTFIFAPMVCIPTLLGSYILAALAHTRGKGSRIYEVMYSLPMAIASAPASAIWALILSSGKSGMLNHLLGAEIRWLLDTKYALASIAVITVWMNLGTGFIFLLTGFRNVNQELLESAHIDGAGYFTRLFKIITPLASPQIFFVAFLNIAASFQAFAQIRLLTQGGPNNTTNVLIYLIYQAAIRDSRFETAFAQSMVLFVIIFTVSMVQFRAEGRMVHYR